MCRISCRYPVLIVVCFFFNDTATTEIYTLSLHDALPISGRLRSPCHAGAVPDVRAGDFLRRSEEHTSEFQSRQYLVCRLLLEKKKKNIYRLLFEKKKKRKKYKETIEP